MKIILVFLLVNICSFSFAKEKSSRRILTLEWEHIEGVSKYEIEVFKVLPNEEPQKLRSFYRKKASWKARLKPGHYKFRLRAYDMREVPGEWGDFNDLNVAYPDTQKIHPAPNVVISPEQEGNIDVEFKWIPLDGVKEYELKIYNLSQKQLLKRTVTGASATISLLIGQKYSWDIIAKTENQKTKSERFPFTISGTVLPKVKFEKDQTLADGQQIHWSPPPQAQFNDLKIYALRLDILNKRDPYKEDFIKEIKDIKDPKYDLANSLLGGMYKVSVSTRADLWQSSKSSEIYLTIKSGKIIKINEVLSNILY